MSLFEKMKEQAKNSKNLNKPLDLLREIIDTNTQQLNGTYVDNYTLEREYKEQLEKLEKELGIKAKEELEKVNYELKARKSHAFELNLDFSEFSKLSFTEQAQRLNITVEQLLEERGIIYG